MPINLPLFTQTPASPGYLLGNGYVPPEGHSLRPYEPSLTEDTRALLGSLLGGGREGNRLGQKVTNVLELLPGTGDAAIVGDSTNAFRRGQNLEGSALAALAGVSMIPLVGSGIVKGVKPLLEDGIRAITNQAGEIGKFKAIIQTPDLRKLSPDEAISTARMEPHLIQSSNGQFIGAPRGAKTIEQIKDNREKFDDHVSAGASGMDWYARGREFNIRSQPNERAQSLAAREQALWSPQATPDPNLNWAVHARTGQEAGSMPDKLRTTQQVKTYNAGGPLGPKTGIFGEHLDPNVRHPTTGTNDIWHARAFGYTGAGGKPFDKALSSQEHRFLDYETMLAVDRANKKSLGGRTDWTADKLQAAAWVAAKGRRIAKDRNVSEAEGIAIASKSYPEYAAKYTVSVPAEQIPARASGALPSLLDASDATKRAFSREAQWSNRGGPDSLLGDVFGGYNLPTQKGTGAYRNTAGEMEYNPIEVGRQLTPFEAKGSERFIPSYMQQGLSSTAAVRGLIDLQEGSPWGKVITHSTGPKTAFNLNMPKAPTKSQMSRAVELGEKYNINVVSNKDGGIAFQRWTEDIFEEAKKLKGKELGKLDRKNAAELNKALNGDLGDDLKKIFPGSTFERGIWSGDYIDLSKQLALKNAGKGSATRFVLESLRELKKEAPGFYDNLINSKGVQIKAKKNLERFEKWEKKLGGAQREDYKKLLRIVGDTKLKGLIDYVKKYGPAGLPAIAVAALSNDLLDVTHQKNASESEDRI